MPKRITYLMAMIVLFPVFIYSQKIPRFDFSNFSVFSIERQILQLLNTEREKRELPPLESFPGLVRLARAHSCDMAQHGRLTHDSSDGKTYPDRLVEAGLYFLGCGENAAFSETFASRIIHQSLMDSPQHRENMLNPDFDRIGIGVIYQRDKGFFITQDFLLSFPKKPVEEIKQKIKKLLTEERETQGLPALHFSPKLDKFAADYIRRDAEGKAPGKAPEILEHMTVFIARTPEIDKIEEDIKKIARDEYSSAGLEIAFGRSGKNIGGEYTAALLLVNKDIMADLSSHSLREELLGRINTIRSRKGRKKLTFDTLLSQQAEMIASRYPVNPRVRIAMATGMRSDQLVIYSTNDPLSLSASTEEIISSGRFHTVGIGIVIDPNPDSPENTYWITIILD